MAKGLLICLLFLFIGETSAFSEPIAKKRKKSRYWQPDTQLAFVSSRPGPRLMDDTSLAVRTAQPALSGFTGTADFRPTWNMGEKEWTGQYAFELGYKFSPKFTLSYVQQVASASTTVSATDVTLEDGYLRGRFNNAFSDPGMGASLGFEPRLYLPLSAASRDHGHITTVRNYFKFDKKLSDQVSFYVWDVPTFHIYSKKGFTGTAADGAPTEEANPLFENRIYFGPAFSWNKGLVTLWTSVTVSQKRYADFSPTAKFNDDWQHALGIYSELTFQVMPNVGIGASYESGNLIQPDFSDFILQQGFNTGSAQFIMTFTF